MNCISRSNPLFRFFVASVALLALGACACVRATAGGYLSDEYVPFVVAFSKKDGTPVVLDTSLKPLKSRQLKLPVVLPPTKGQSGTQLQQTYTFRGTEFKGSHYLIIELGPGLIICVDLWHWDGSPPGNTCAELGFPKL